MFRKGVRLWSSPYVGRLKGDAWRMAYSLGALITNLGTAQGKHSHTTGRGKRDRAPREAAKHGARVSDQ